MDAASTRLDWYRNRTNVAAVIVSSPSDTPSASVAGQIIVVDGGQAERPSR
jgi:hypothetical protein